MTPALDRDGEAPVAGLKTTIGRDGTEGRRCFEQTRELGRTLRSAARKKQTNK